jgi:hypothetical protein
MEKLRDFVSNAVDKTKPPQGSKAVRLPKP